MKTRYWYNKIVGKVRVFPTKNSSYWININNVRSDCQVSLSQMLSDKRTEAEGNEDKEITHHQFIMWLCFGEEIK